MSKKRPSDHIRVQREGRVRDRNACQICGSRENVQGHHIIDFQYGGAASVDNIISLCQKHHSDVHNGRIDIMKI